ncbi:alpha/beta hydrolase [Actinosynnema sp. NPDC050436]|uniref:alpha/beta hydrolase n=1 Tax=Actinosynnema sp. NPDC050436 TaxID=3155659 RepID=UPI0033C5E14A
MNRIAERAVAVAAVLAVGAPPAAADPVRPTPSEQQAVDWHGCRTGPEDEVGARLDAVGARCAEVVVPLDYRKPGGRTITVAVARRPATDGAARLGPLVVNTGGPGPSRDGVSFVAENSPQLAARYDLIGIDPRFFGRSTPLECGWPTGRYLRSAQSASPDRASFDRSAAVAEDLAARCAGRRDLLPHASTRNIARDQDVVRAVLGERRVSYLGWSYGTYLGAVYLQMFPGRADRVVLDSALDPDAYGPAVTRETGPADAAALEDWAGWAAAHDAEYGLGGTAARVLDTVEEVRRAATRRPLRVGDHRVDAATLPGLLLTVDDSDASYAAFSARVRVLRDAAGGAPVTPTPDLAQILALYDDPGVSAAFGFSAGEANKCADRAASRDPESYYRDIRAHQAAEPLYGPLARDITPCAFWPTAPVEPPTAVGNAHPALIVGASGDPVTPYRGQLTLHRALSGSRMVTLAGAFRHGVHGFAGAACVDRAVERYLLDGVLPAADVTCPA